MFAASSRYHMDCSYKKSQLNSAKDGNSGDQAVTYHYTTGHPNLNNMSSGVTPITQLPKQSVCQRLARNVSKRVQQKTYRLVQRLPQNWRLRSSKRKLVKDYNRSGIPFEIIDRKGKWEPKILKIETIVEIKDTAIEPHEEGESLKPTEEMPAPSGCLKELAVPLEMIDTNGESESKLLTFEQKVSQILSVIRIEDQSMQPKQELAAPYACGQSLIVTTSVVTNIVWHKFIVSSEDMFKQMVFSAKRQIQMTFVETMSDTKSTHLKHFSLEIHNKWSLEERVESNTDEREETFEERLQSIGQTLQTRKKEVKKKYDFSNLSDCLQKNPQIKQEIDSNKAIRFEKKVLTQTRKEKIDLNFGNLSVCRPNKSRQIDKAFIPKIEWKTKPIVSKIETKEKSQPLLSKPQNSRDTKGSDLSKGRVLEYTLGKSNESEVGLRVKSWRLQN